MEKTSASTIKKIFTEKNKITKDEYRNKILEYINDNEFFTAGTILNDTI